MLCALAVLATMPFASTVTGFFIVLALLTACLASAMPFITQLLRRDRSVGVIAPIFIGLRALGLALGCMCGVLHFYRPFGRSKPSESGDSEPKNPPSVESESTVEEKSHEFV